MAILRLAASCQTRVNTKTAAANINNRHKPSVIFLNSMQQHAQLSPTELLVTRNIHRPIRHSLQGSHPSIHPSPPTSTRLPSKHFQTTAQPISNSPTPTFNFSDYLKVTTTTRHQQSFSMCHPGSVYMLNRRIPGYCKRRMSIK